MTWITLKSGRKFDLSDPTPDMFTLEDIAEGLAKECRYNGQCVDHYSVAQHSVLGSQMIEPEYALEFLFHDAEEFVWRDMSSPAKQMLTDYRVYTARTDAAIRLKFGLPRVHSPRVKVVDNRMYATERRDVAPYGNWETLDEVNQDESRWASGRYQAEPFENLKIIPWNWVRARKEFMETYWLLTK
jgi:hypothetical protein